MKKLRAILLTALLLICLMIPLAGCSTASTMAEGGSAKEIYAAFCADLFGEEEQEYDLIVVSLPRHAGYEVISDKTAYMSLRTDEQRAAYDQIEESVFMITKQGGEGRYEMKRAMIPSLTSGEIFMVKEAVLADHPEAFWITGEYSLGHNLHDGDYLNLYSRYSYAEIIEMSDALENEVAMLLKEMPSDLPEFERELAIHDFLVRDVTYDSVAAESGVVFSDSSTAYGALVNNRAVCSGYSQAAKLMLNRVGISCCTVKGISKGVGHMWNMVRIGGKWYHLDVTWDDPAAYSAPNIASYDYFNLPDTYIRADHEIAENYDKLTEAIIAQQGGNGIDLYNFDTAVCDSLDENFYERRGVKINTLSSDSRDIVKALMVQCARTGEENIYLCFPRD
ncbi:MAG: hypothetical protein IJC18_02195, partial [Clostridia bacterium]|nr:hypothetical protein [Clostridia bacterium]